MFIQLLNSKRLKAKTACMKRIPNVKGWEITALVTTVFFSFTYLTLTSNDVSRLLAILTTCSFGETTTNTLCWGSISVTSDQNY